MVLMQSQVKVNRPMNRKRLVNKEVINQIPPVIKPIQMELRTMVKHRSPKETEIAMNKPQLTVLLKMRVRRKRKRDKKVKKETEIFELEMTKSESLNWE